MLRPDQYGSGLTLLVIALGSSGEAVAAPRDSQRPAQPVVVSVQETCAPDMFRKNRWVLTRAKRYDNGVTVTSTSGEACQPRRTVTVPELPSIRTVLNTTNRRQAVFACRDGVTVRVAPDGRIDPAIMPRDRGLCTIAPARRMK